jgi:HEAT repeat protein
MTRTRTRMTMRKTTKTAFMMALAVLPAVSPASAQDVPPARERAEREAALVEARMAAARALLPTPPIPEPWLQEDPGAELYQEAREALNDGRYRRAAQLLRRLREDHPGSGYLPDSFYWEAFARHRIGGRGRYRAALELLARQARDHPDARTRADADELRVRIEAELARRGDAEAAEAVARQAADPCAEDQSLRGAALSALLHMNAEQALPILREVLGSRDECSVELRRRAVFLVSQRMTEESVDILLDLAHRNPDPDPEVREQAVFWLSQVRSDEALEALASVLRETDDPELQERAVFALSQHGSERAVELLRSYAERPEADPEIRAHAIFWIGEAGHAAGTSYLRELYPRLEDPELKERVVFGVGRNADPESRAWLLERAGDPSEEMELRKNALFWAGQSGAVAADDLRRLLASFDDPEMREQLVFVASRSDDPEAVDFLMEVAASGGDRELREKAIFWLGQSEDPRVAGFLLELLRR